MNRKTKSRKSSSYKVKLTLNKKYKLDKVASKIQQRANSSAETGSQGKEVVRGREEKGNKINEGEYWEYSKPFSGFANSSTF